MDCKKLKLTAQSFLVTLWIIYFANQIALQFIHYLQILQKITVKL